MVIEESDRRLSGVGEYEGDRKIILQDRGTNDR